jgi:hypothetical protein
MMSKIYSFVGRYGSLMLAFLWLALTIGNAILWTHDSRIAALYCSQLFLAWMLIYTMEGSNRRFVEKLVNRRG